MKILLVEDVRVEREILKHWLEEIGCEVIEAANGNDGLDLYHRHRPELVITDIIMPQKDGVQMMIKLQRKYSDVSIFAISGAGAKRPGECLPLAKGAGALRVFAKPIEKRELVDAVLDYIESDGRSEKD